MTKTRRRRTSQPASIGSRWTIAYQNFGKQASSSNKLKLITWRIWIYFWYSRWRNIKQTNKQIKRKQTTTIGLYFFCKCTICFISSRYITPTLHCFVLPLLCPSLAYQGNLQLNPSYISRRATNYPEDSASTIHLICLHTFFLSFFLLFSRWVIQY